MSISRYLPGHGHGRLGTDLRQGVKPRTLSAAQHQSDHVSHVDSMSATKFRRACFAFSRSLTSACLRGFFRGRGPAGQAEHDQAEAQQRHAPPEIDVDAQRMLDVLLAAPGEQAVDRSSWRLPARTSVPSANEDRAWQHLAEFQSALPEDIVQDHAGRQENHAQNGRPQEPRSALLLDLRSQRIDESLQVLIVLRAAGDQGKPRSGRSKR